jgi:hypothetical protein
MPSFIEIGQKKGAIAIFIDAKLDSVGHCLLNKGIMVTLDHPHRATQVRQLD